MSTNVSEVVNKQRAVEKQTAFEPFVLPMDSAAEEICQIIEPTIVAEGCDLVQVHVVRGARRTTLRIFIDTMDPESHVGLDKLASFNRLLGDLLEVEDQERGLFKGAWDLEVSSPGVNRTLSKKSHFKRFEGEIVKIKSRLKMGTGRNHAGKLESTSEEGVTIRLEGSDESVQIEWSNLEDAHIVFQFAQPQPKRPKKKKKASTQNKGNDKKKSRTSL